VRVNHKHGPQPKLKLKESSPEHGLCIKNVSMHDYSQLSKLKDNFLHKEPFILIARITPIVSKNPEKKASLVNEIYSAAIQNKYSVFRLGEGRIIAVPNSVRIEEEVL
jgi:SepF-like predicted cell division protein (DUF552 family)